MTTTYVRDGEALSAGGEHPLFLFAAVLHVRVRVRVRVKSQGLKTATLEKTTNNKQGSEYWCCVLLSRQPKYSLPLPSPRLWTRGENNRTGGAPGAFFISFSIVYPLQTKTSYKIKFISF